MEPQDPLTTHIRLHDLQRRALLRLSIETVADLLYHFPARYETSGEHTTVSGLTHGTEVTLFGTLRKPETRRAWKSKRPMSEAMLEDGTGSVKLMWFNQPYIAKMLTEGTMVRVNGRVEGKSSLYIANPEIVAVASLPQGGSDTVFGETEPGERFAVYPETKGITSRWFRHAIDKVLRSGVHQTLEDPIPDAIRTRYHLPSLATALTWIHRPEDENDATSARKRFAFEEVFVIQTTKALERASIATAPTYPLPHGTRHAEAFLKRLPFLLTPGQATALTAIMDDTHAAPAMSRLLEGDVGSGKTAVAAAAAYATVQHHPEKRPSAPLQVAYMAPTEILAEQHFASFCELFAGLPIHIGLITGSGCKKFPSKSNTEQPTKVSKAQLKKWVDGGEIAIIIGTHALTYESVQFRDLALVIIDEQHRFGTGQRKKLVHKDAAVPHLLSMTATPIPRTLALTLYGDLDITVLSDMPPGRKPVKTKVVGKTGRPAMYEVLRRELDGGRQAYVICPRIDEPDPRDDMALQTKSVLAEADRLKREELKGYRIQSLHGQMKPKEKDNTMRAFLAHEIDVLVATSVVEVGVNVPNATVIIIEGAERFGLAQLHQLRGRVVRSTHQAHCFVLSSEGNVTTRLRALEKSKNGFELAEMDLKIRGPGELYGRSQSGLTDLGMEALKNIKMVEAARTEARHIVTEDPTLTAHPPLHEAVAARRGKLHFE